MSFNKILEGLTEIGQTSGRLKKEKIFNQLLEKDGERFKQVLNYAFNPFFTYGVTIDETTLKWAAPDYDASNSNVIWKSFMYVLDQLRARKITGGAARQAVDAQLKAGPAYAFWMVRILNKDLKIGLANKTVAKHIPGFLPKLSPMLCDTFDIEELRNYADWYYENKHDGIRGIVAIENGVTRVQTRSGKTVSNTDIIEDHIKSLGIDNAVFDGEFMASTFKETMQILTTHGVRKDRGNVKFWIFDVLPIQDWKAQECKIPLKLRKEALKQALARRDSTFVLKAVVSRQFKTGSVEEIGVACDEAVENGYEGIVMKKPDSLYEWKRTKTWLKYKPYFECDLKIVGIEEGQGTRKGKCGALICSGTVTFKGKKYKIFETEVGAGLSAKQTVQFWNDHHSGTLAGRTVEVRFQEVSDWDVDKKTHKLKFARLRRMRPDKD